MDLAPFALRLVVASVAGGALALLVAALCRLLPLPPVLRCWLWWAVALRLLIGLAPLPSVDVPVPLATSASRPVGSPHPISTLSAAPRSVPASRAVMAGASPTVRDAHVPSQPRSWTRASLLVGAWAIAVLLLAARDVVRLARTRRARAAATPVVAGPLADVFVALRARLGVRRAELRLSDAVMTPQAVGVLQPTVLLPTAMAAELAGDELAMALAHELVHLRRGDLRWGLVPAVAARLFFFHPLARLAAHEHALAREEACDAAVVARVAPSPRAYGRLLLALALDGGPALPAAAAATHPSLERRLRMLLHPSRSRVTAWIVPVALVAAGALVPLRVVAREVTAARSTILLADGGPVSGVDGGVEGGVDSGVQGGVDGGVRGGIAPAEARDALAASDERLARASAPAVPHDADEDGHDAYVYFHGRDTTMSGSMADVGDARRARHGNEDLLWVRRDGERWVVRDPEVLRRIDALFAPQRELGDRQSALGDQQSALGDRQSKLGDQQSALGNEQSKLGDQQAALGDRQARLGAQIADLSAQRADLDADSNVTRAERDRRVEDLRQKEDALSRQQDELSRQQDALARQQEELSRRQSALGDQQSKLGEQQSALGEKQSELGRQQDEAARRARRALRAVVDQAIRDGKAERE